MKKGPPRKKGYDINAVLRCDNCNTTFKGISDPRRKNRFCCRKCYYAFHVGERNSNFRGGDFDSECKQCGGKFTQKRVGYIRSCCSSECVSAYINSRDKMGEFQARTSKYCRRHLVRYIRESFEPKKIAARFGFTADDLKAHLEPLFKPGMTWENHGDWQIDHVIPICSFRYESYDDPQFKACWALKNLQPLWEKENLLKGRKI